MFHFCEMACFDLVCLFLSLPLARAKDWDVVGGRQSSAWRIRRERKKARFTPKRGDGTSDCNRFRSADVVAAVVRRRKSAEAVTKFRPSF